MGFRVELVPFRAQSDWVRYLAFVELLYPATALSMSPEMLETSDMIESNLENLDAGYKSCRQENKKNLQGYVWCLSNMPTPKRNGLASILFQLQQTLGLMELKSQDGSAVDSWVTKRDELNEAFQGQAGAVEQVALVKTCEKFGIPKQYIFDPLKTVDTWIRSHEFKTWSELESFASQVGGSTMAAMVPVMGTTKEGWEDHAIEAGTGIFLTQMLAHSLTHMKQNLVLIAQEDLQTCDVDVSKVRTREGGKDFRHLVRIYVSRIEKILQEGAHLVSHMDFDGKRTVKAMLDFNWKLLTKIKVDPELVLSEEGVLTSFELLKFKTKFLMGIDSSLAIFPEDHGHH